MKDLMPPPVMQAATASDVTPVGSIKKAVNASGTAVSSGVAADSPEANTSFLDSLEGLLQSLSTQDDATAPHTMGGKSLPLTSTAAESGPLASSTDATDTQAQEDMVVMAALPLGTLTTSTQDADVPTQAAILSDMSKLMPQTASRVANTPAADVASDALGGLKAPEPEVTLQAGQVLTRPEVFMSSDVPMARMQLGSLDSTPKLDSINTDIALKAGSVPQLNRGDVADIQYALKTDTGLNETDQLFTSRMQLAAVNQSIELVGQKLAFDGLLNTTQSTSTESVQASLARSPLPQTTLSTDSLTASSHTTITESIAKPEWGQGMGKQILWMVNQNISRAEIRLNPANLGPLEVRIDMDNEQVNIAFTSRHAEVRDAVEQAMPRLREMLEEKGLDLSDADVSQHSFAEQHEQAFGDADEHKAGFASSLSLPDDGDQLAQEGHHAALRNDVNDVLNEGLVDYYI